MQNKPNIILIITDQQRADTLGLYGSKVNATPNIDKMGEEGVCFNGYCNNPLCMPSRASLLTGRYSSNTGVRTNGCLAYPGQPLLGELLTENGYDTAAFGKIHYHPWNRNFDEYREEEKGYPYTPEHPTYWKKGEDLDRPYLGFTTMGAATGHNDVGKGIHWNTLKEKHPELIDKAGPDNAVEYPDEILANAPKIFTYKTQIPLEHYMTTWITDQTIKFIENAEKPFFIWCGIPDPHHPFKAPEGYFDKYSPDEMPRPVKKPGELEDKPPHFRDYQEGKYKEINTDGFTHGTDPYLSDERVAILRSVYYGMVSLIDDSIERIREAVNKKGILNDTVFIFVSDHGELLGDHGFMLKGPMHYQSLLRVPFVWNWEGHFPKGKKIDGVASLIDIFPTVLDLTGTPIPEGTQGRSLVNQLTGKADRAFDEVLVEDDSDQIGLRMRTLVTDRYRMTCYEGKTYGELYDLQNDPDEFVNIWDTCDRTVKAQLMEHMLQEIMRNQDRLPKKTSHA